MLCVKWLEVAFVRVEESILVPGLEVSPGTSSRLVLTVALVSTNVDSEESLGCVEVWKLDGWRGPEETVLRDDPVKAVASASFADKEVSRRLSFDISDEAKVVNEFVETIVGLDRLKDV